MRGIITHAPNSNLLSGIISNFRSSGLSDWVDIILITVVIYALLSFVRKTRAGQVVKGAIVLFVFFAVAEIANLRTVKFVLTSVMSVGVLAVIILFQPELRRALEQMGRTEQWLRHLLRQNTMEEGLRGKWRAAVLAICDAAEQLSDTRTGALIVMERGTNLAEIIRTGTPVHADVNPEMLGTIFYEGTPLHDGACIVRDGELVAAGCVLPLSNNLEMGKDMGTRHRAALGMSENSDAVVVVVSEETGIISMAREGVLMRRLDRQKLYNMLEAEIIPEADPEGENPSLMRRLLRRKKTDEKN